MYQASKQQATLLRSSTFLVVAGTVCAFCSMQLSPPPFGPGVEPIAVARTLVRTGSFADPYSLPTGPTAHMAPLHPAYWAVLLRAFGESASALRVGFGLIALSFGASLALLPGISERMFGEHRAGILAGWLAVFIVPLVGMFPDFETTLLAAGTVTFSYVCSRAASEWIIGFIAGVLALLNPTGMLFMCAWFARQAPRELGSATVALAVCAVVCAPWVIRNATVLGAVALRDNAGIELHVSNNPIARASFHDNFVSLSQLHPSYSLEQATAVRETGEVKYNQLKLRAAADWIISAPGDFLDLSFRRLLLFWFPAPERRYGWAVWLVTLLSIPGVWLARRQNHDPGAAVLGLLAFMLPYCFVQADIRYRMPVLWVTLLYAGVTLERCYRWFAARPTQEKPAIETTRPQGTL